MGLADDELIDAGDGMGSEDEEKGEKIINKSEGRETMVNKSGEKIVNKSEGRENREGRENIVSKGEKRSIIRVKEERIHN